MFRTDNVQWESEEEPFVQSESTSLEKLKQQSMLSNLQLLQLAANDEKFHQILNQYNKNGVVCIHDGRYEEALVYLEEAQKILQYAANCGKTIDRFLIIATLQNQASAYQKLWELEKSADYLEAILYNMNSYLETSQPVEMNHSIRNPHSEASQTFKTFISKRIDAAVYNLQYSAVSSQIGKHQIALLSAKKALELMCTVLTELYSFECFVKNKINKNSSLKALRDWCRGPKKQKVVPIIHETRNKLKEAKKKGSNKFLSEEYKSFSIGDVMQIQPTQFGGKNESINFQFQTKQLIKKALYVSIAYYAMATEMRILANTTSAASETEERERKDKIIKSKTCHLKAINIVLDFVPCETDYLQHTIKSYKNNYHVNLEALEPVEDSDDDSSEITLNSFDLKQNQRTFQLQNEIFGGAGKQFSLHEEANYSLEKKRYSLDKNCSVTDRSKPKKGKKIYKVQSCSNLKVVQNRFEIQDRKDKKKSTFRLKKQRSKSKKSFSNIKQEKSIQNLIKRDHYKPKKSANSTEKTKDQTRKKDDKKKKTLEHQKTSRIAKFEHVEKKKKTKKNSKTKIIRFKSPLIKSSKHLSS